MRARKTTARRPPSGSRSHVNKMQMETRSASWQHRAFVVLLRLLRINRAMSAERCEDTIRKWAGSVQVSDPHAKAVRGLSVGRHEHAGWPVWKLSGDDRTERVVVAVHGGGFVQEIQPLHWKIYADLARATKATVLVPIYPLAPRATAGTVVPALADLLANVCARYGAQAVGVIGDSAGGTLAMAATQELVRRGQPPPSRLALIAPLLDATMSDPESAAIDDPILGFAGCVAIGKLWAGALDPAHPLVSPLSGSLQGLPPTLVGTGSLDVLYPQTLRLQERARKEGANISCELLPGLCHGWAALNFVPETRALLPRMFRFLVGEAT